VTDYLPPTLNEFKKTFDEDNKYVFSFWEYFLFSLEQI
jgi:hypothetical protein